MLAIDHYHHRIVYRDCDTNQRHIERYTSLSEAFAAGNRLAHLGNKVWLVHKGMPFEARVRCAD